MSKFAPIVLFAFNRIDHTKRTVEGLLTNPEASQSSLYVFCDGPKKDASAENKNRIKQVREFIHSIDGFKEIQIEEFAENQGLANITIYGMGKVFNKFDRAIMMEDDDVPSPFFLSYINGCLEKYAKDDSIWCVSGYIDNDYIPPRDGDDLFLVNRPSSWGFGTWKRCWDKVIWDLSTLKGIFSHDDVVVGYNHWAGMDSAGIMFATFKNEKSSWSIRYNFAAYLNRSYTILPNKSLIVNIGMDGSGTHGANTNHVATLMDREIIIPKEIKFDPIRNEQLHKSFSGHGIRGVISRLSYNCPKIGRFIFRIMGREDYWPKKLNNHHK